MGAIKLLWRVQRPVLRDSYLKERAFSWLARVVHESAASTTFDFGMRIVECTDTSLQSDFRNPKSEISNLKSQGGLATQIHELSGLRN
jgi:hypothetical protein